MTLHIGAVVRFVSLSCGIVLQRCSNFFLMRAALSSFSMMPLLFERRYTAGSRRAGLLRPNPVCTRRAKNGYTTRCVCTKKKKKKRFVSSVRVQKTKRRRAADEDHEDQRETHVDDLALFLGNDHRLSFGRRFRRRFRRRLGKRRRR